MTVNKRVFQKQSMLYIMFTEGLVFLFNLKQSAPLISILETAKDVCSFSFSNA